MCHTCELSHIILFNPHHSLVRKGGHFTDQVTEALRSKVTCMLWLNCPFWDYAFELQEELVK